MTSSTCPHCGSHNHRLVADRQGIVGWCGDCHRTWEHVPQRGRPATAATPPEPAAERGLRHG